VSYDELYQNGVIRVSNIGIASNGVDTTTLTFTLLNGATGVDCKKTTAFSIGAYYDTYNTGTRQFNAASPLSLKPAAAGITSVPATGACTFTKVFTSAADKALVAAITTADGIIVVYGADEVLEVSGHLTKSKYPFGGLLRLGAAMGVAAAPYVSAANVSGCENCHTQPFNKHAYIPGTVDDLTAGTASATQGFYVCKGCHSDARDGGHQFWQLLKEAKDADKTTAAGQALRARAVAVDGGAALTADETTKYAYKRALMNDVHMSHAMEFAYPQSMRNCVTCHDGKMDETTGIFKLANFKAETCISCHAPDGIIGKMKAASFTHPTYVTDVATLKAASCSTCHDGATAPSFKTIHTGGYDPKIYAASGTRYSTSITVAIGAATYDAVNYKLTVPFTAAGSVGSLQATSITPTVVIGLYGYNTKDFIVGAHSSDANGKRYLEYKWTDTNPRFTKSGGSGSWQVIVDLSEWKTMIDDGTIKRAEIAVLPELKSGTLVLGLNAPSRTFDLTVNAFDDAYFTDIVNVQKTNVTNSKGRATVKGCNTCHDQLATTFHSGTRGGNIRVCRLCHVKSNAGGHLEVQSRSIDSYVHAIHSFQPFDVADIDFADAFEAMEYRHHTGTEFPRFGFGNGSTDCESCHVTGKYGVSDQSKSLPALWSASDTLTGTTRNIGTVPSYVSGPATTACGGCHRAQKIVADDAGALTSLFSHWKSNGYLIENVTTLWNAVVAKVMN
jgi:OmcA/MtrC family decaheme c-type cytochrome